MRRCELKVMAREIVRLVRVLLFELVPAWCKAARAMAHPRAAWRVCGELHRHLNHEQVMEILEAAHRQAALHGADPGTFRELVHLASQRARDGYRIDAILEELATAAELWQVIESTGTEAHSCRTARPTSQS